ncbi:amino acid ABC transporter permease [Gammaproteobacteria bacterium 42_54_T18]|nr:amino acid ABC transporter permease [Gammaproteobacteria bacterium 42_54_T18]
MLIKQNANLRAWLYQALFIIGVIGTCWLLTDTLLENLARQGIVTGLDFLDNNAGFGVIFSLIDYSESDSYGRVFFVGLFNTLLVAGLGILFSTILGFILGIARLSHNFLARNIASAYIGLFRNVPLLLHLFFWYFAVLQPLPGPRQSLEFMDTFFLNNRGLYVPTLIDNANTTIWQYTIGISFAAVILLFLISASKNTRKIKNNEKISKKSHAKKATSLLALTFVGILLSLFVGNPYDLDTPIFGRFNFSGGTVIIPELIALVLALSLYTAAYIAEIVRAGIESVPKGQKEAANSLGLSTSDSLRFVIIPQALRLIIPPLTNQYLNLTKNSSLAAAIAYPDLVSIFAGTVLNQTGQAVEIIGITMLVYLSISVTISLIMSLYEKKNRWNQQ